MVQQLLVGIAVLGAIAYLAWKLLQKPKSGPGCDKCAKS
jgi:hypothetical protein